MAIPKATVIGAFLPLIVVLLLGWNVLASINEARHEERRISQGIVAADKLDDAGDARTGSSTDNLAAAHHTIAARTLLLVLAAPWAASIALLVFNRGNRREVAALQGTLERVADGKLESGLDRRFGPIHRALDAPFGHAVDSVRDQLERMNAWPQRTDVELRLGDHFEGVTSRSDVAAAVVASFDMINPNVSMELMVTASDGRRLFRVASSSEAGAPGCPVDNAALCPAMSSASTLTWPDPQAAAACKYLRVRNLTGGAVCVPLLTPRDPAGVIHTTAQRSEEIDVNTVEYLETLADLTTNRLSTVTSMEQTMWRASTDQLTGLANRRMFEERAQRLMAEDTEYILVMADLDHFKRLNDAHGHDVGDRVLRIFARVLSENVRRTDLAVRYGGEEFLVVLPQTSMTEALVTLDRVRLAFATTLSVHTLPPTTASFGVARSSLASTLDSILRVADAGLYRAKADGRDRIVEADLSTVEDMFG